MAFLPVFLWSDLVIWLLVAALGLLAWGVARTPPLRAAWGRVLHSRTGMASLAVLALFVAVGLLDSAHYRPRLADAPQNGQGGGVAAAPAYGVEVLSLLDALLTPLRTQVEKTYSAPLATRAYAKEMQEVRQPDGSLVQQRDFPRLKFGGAHLGTEESAWAGDVARRLLQGYGLAALLWGGLAIFLVGRLARRRQCSFRQSWRDLWWRPPTSTAPAWDALLLTLAGLFLLLTPLLALAPEYHVLGTDKVGQDILYLVLKSIRTSLVIGLVTTLVTLPIGVLLGISAGYFRGWVDDLIQYLYSTLNSIPSVLLIAAAVLMMQVVIDTHPEWFATAAERADLRLLALCFILGMTSWTGLARLLRGEALKLSQLEYIQAAQSFGVSSWRILLRHILPNVMHIVLIALVMDFSSLVMTEAVLSYLEIGVDPTMVSFGSLINNARMELAREPMVWWSLAAAFVFMFILVLAANLFADVVRDAFDPRAA
ncbi:ABC transporter permease [Azospira sp. APE16]|uniref:ABC-type dipeptide/oligopeptide/nickel transport system, permease component n=1 Tax=Azospira oryzae (strain ATCC BAA-33 / DSM 13638 / PS) TaxID=640081 RepID=G8QFM6_AZOOP|nr:MULTISPECIES: ABC transporter permease [Azospira]AEV27139.1 ABC-type dipeptide/oligopeptide/nickel transport system, permease component [Azospira oryzae PS]MDK9691601.1 ABC transporter permease [Azospira sp.]